MTNSTYIQNMKYVRIRKILQNQKYLLHFFAAFFVLLLVGVENLSGATKTWSGGTGTTLNWTTGANWGGTAPIAGDDIVFNTAGTITFTTLPGSNIAFNSLTISQGTISLAGGNTRTFTIGGNAGVDFTVASGASFGGNRINITLANNATATIEGIYSVSNGLTFNTNGTNVVTTVTGTIVNAGTVTCTTASKLLFNSGSTYQHALNGGTIPTATWNLASTCNVTGITNTVPGAINQTFGNFTWNCTAQGTNNLNTTFSDINGSFSIINTGLTGSIRLINNTNQTLNIGENLNVSGGILNLSRGSGILTLNVAGNFTHTAGTITESGSGQGSIVFNGNTTQTYTSGGTVSNNINFIVNSGTTLQMADDATVVGNGSAGTFALASGATLGVTSADGITTTGTTGNIRVGGTRTYNSGANYTYNGSGAQVTGAGLTQNTPANLSIDNPTTVTLSAATTASGDLLLSQGTLSTSGSNFNISIGGNWTNNGGTFSPGTGTVSMNGSGGIIGGTTSTTFNNLTINNAGGASLGISTTINNLLTLTSGNLTTTPTNLLTITNTATNAIVGGSESSFINGPVNWTLPSGLVSGSTYNFPVGSGTTYLPFALVNPTTSGSASAQVQAVVGTSGGTANVVASLVSKSNTEYWALTTTGSFTNGSVSLTRPTAISPNDLVGGSTTLTGTYTSLLGTAGTFDVSNSNAIGTNRFFTFARELKTITTGAITGTTFCSGASVSVPYTILGTYLSGNEFTAQLSDAAGSFTSPVAIGSVISTTSGTISATIPANTPTGTGYRIRVVSSNPAITGTINGANLSIFIFPTAPTTTGSFICIGTTTGTVLSASGAVSGEVYRWYSAASGGTLLKTSSNNTDDTYTTPTINLTTDYWVSISNSGGCETSRVKVTATAPSPSVTNQTLAGTDKWIGHVYDGINFNTYYGTITSNITDIDTIDNSFLGNSTCYPFTSVDSTFSIRTETFSVRYRMNSTKKGLYTVDLGSDDGSRLTIDGNSVYNNWTLQAFSLKPRVLMSLTGSSSLIYEFYENSGENRVVFQNIKQVLANNLTTNTTQGIYVGTSGSAISGDIYGTLESGISLSGTGYQWTYSTSPGGARTNIAGATGATYTPNASVAPFNAGGTFYIYRNAVLSSTNNVSPTTYVSTNESNAATLEVYVPTITTSVSSLTGLSYIVGNGPSAEQSFTVGGTQLTNNISIAPPTNYEISLTSGAGFSPTTPIVLTQTGGTVTTTTIYVRLKAGLPASNYNLENISATSTGATTMNIVCSGSVTTPTITTSTNSLSDFNYDFGSGPSAEQLFTVSGISLTADLVVSSPTNYEISLTSGAGFSPTTPIVLTQTGGTVATTTIYVRLKSGLGVGNYTAQNITSSSSGATTQQIALSGSVNQVYCASSGTTEFPTSITLVNFNTINNSSAKPSGYSNYTAQTTTLYAGNAYNLTVNLNTDGDYPIYARARFDWNKDGDFSDSGESISVGIAQNTTNGPTSLSPLSINIPITALPGNTRMRISAKYNIDAAACESDFDGEVEDYTINIIIPTITTGTITGSPFISGSSISVPFSASSGFVSVNTFTAQLSNASGSFASPVNIGTLISTTSGTISATIPANTITGNGYLIRVVSNSPGVIGSDNGSNLTISNQPYLVAAPTSLSFTYQLTAGPSAIQSFTVTGVNMDENAVVTPSSSFDVSLTGGATFSAQPFVTLPVSGGSINRLVYVRMKAGFSIGTIAPENLIISSLGATDVNVSCSGTVTAQPVITVSTSPVTDPVSISGFTATFKGTASSNRNFTVSGLNLMGNITLEAPAGYEIKTAAQSVYVTSLPLTPSGSTLIAIVINVRLKSGLGVGTYNGNIVASSPYAESKTVILSGVVNPVATLTTSTSWLAGFIYSGAGPSASQTFQLYGANLGTNDVTVTPPADFELSTGTTWNTGAFTISPTSGSVNQILYARLRSGRTAGTVYGPQNVTLSAPGAVVKTVALSGYVANVATLLVSKNSLNGFGYLFGTGPSVTQKVTISGAVLSQDITVTPPANYEILNPNTGLYQTTAITLARTGTTVNATEVTLRLAAGWPAGNYNGNIVVSSSGATSKSVALTGKVFASPLISSTGGGSFCIGETIYLTSSGTDVQSQFWTGPNNYYSILANPTIVNATTQMSGNYTVTGNVIVGGNLIVNGDFEMDNAGFGSSYVYAAPITNALYPEGLYTVTNLASNVHGNFNSVPDKNIIGTKQMIINGNTTAGAVVWTQSVPVVPSSEYEFTYWLQTVVNGIDPAPSKLQLYVNGEIAGPVYTANPSTGIWTQYIYNTASGSNNILNLELINQTTAANGNDFALDSISFKQILSATSTQNVIVNPSVTASVTVTHSPTIVYQNTPVVFTATPVNGGTTPTYKWFVGGVEQVGQTDQTFTYTPTSTGSVNVTCQMTSSIQCASPKPAIGSDPITVLTPPANYWMGYIDTDWGKTGNWTANYIPATGDNVIYATVANFGSAAIRNLQLDINRTIGSLINATIRSLIIPPARTLIVNNTINVTPPTTIPVTKAEDLVLIKASTTLANGSIKYNNPQNNPAFGTVEMYSPASWDINGGFNNVFKWQFFGIPVKSLPVLPTFYGAHVRELFENDNDTTTHWQSVSDNYVLQPFIGYELCQQNANTLYTFKGQLINSNFSSGQFIKTTGALYPGQHLFANPYTAAMDIKLIEFGAGVEATAYLYSTGTFVQWRNLKNSIKGATPGQYFAVPKAQAGDFGIPRQVPSMGTLMVRIPPNASTNELSFVNFNYNIVAMGNSERQRAKAASATDSQAVTIIDIESENAEDRMWIMSHENYSRNFDNGYDGKKLIGNALNPQLYAVENDGNYQINSVDDINNTSLAFQAGQDTEYTMTFTHNENTQVKYKKMFLHDLIENKIIDISMNGTVYNFTAASTTEPVLRFKVLAQILNEELKKVSNTKIYHFDNQLFVQNFSEFEGRVYVYDISGRTVGIKTISANQNIQIAAPRNNTYIVKIVVGSVTETTKIFLQ